MTTVIVKGPGAERMVASATELFRMHGYNGTGLRDVIAHSGAPRGSLYHHFPGGKAELGRAALALAGDFIGHGFRSAFEAGDVVAGLALCLSQWTAYVEAGGFQAGCPVLAVAAESHPDAPDL